MCEIEAAAVCFLGHIPKSMAEPSLLSQKGVLCSAAEFSGLRAPCMCVWKCASDPGPKAQLCPAVSLLPASLLEQREQSGPRQGLSYGLLYITAAAQSQNLIPKSVLIILAAGTFVL